MKKIIRYGDVLFSTLSEITSLIVAGHDKRMIFRKVLDCALQVIEADTIHLLEVDGQTVSKYTVERGKEMKFEVVDDAGDVGVVALQRGGELAHRQRLLGVEVQQREALDGGEADVLKDGEVVRPAGDHQLTHEPPGLGDVVEPGIDPWRRRRIQRP